MRIVYLLLAFFVLVLSASPCCAVERNVGDVAHQTKKSVPSDDCKEACSPFFACGNCHIVSSSVIFLISISAPVLWLKNGLTSREDCQISSFYTSIWQPPKRG